MERANFEEWAPQEIERLRRQADALQEALDLYLGGGGHANRQSSRQTPRLAGAKPSRGTKYESLLAAYERAERPLSINEMLSIANEKGFDLDRANMRSLIWAQKKVGRATPHGEDYLWRALAKPDSETASAEKEDAV